MAEVMNKIMKKYLFTAAAMMVAMTSCVKEADVVVPQDDNKVWVEFAAGVQTKVALNDNAVIWEKDDKVSINGVEFAVKNESISDDKTTATFGAYVEPSFLEAENFTAVYPVEAVSWEGEYAPKVTIPTLQDGAANIVAMATVDDLESALAFRHVASFIKFQVPAEVSVVKLQVPAEGNALLAGSFHDISFGVDGNDKVTSITYSEVPYAATSITLTLPEDAKFLPATDYYAAVIPGVKENLTLSFDDKVYKTWESVNIKQGMIAKVSAKKERNLAYKLADEVVTEVAYTMGTEFTAPVLTGEMTGVVYASSNAEVATVSETGVVTVLAVGTTTITASAEENNTHLAGSASYTLTVTAAPKVERNLAFDPESVTVTYGETFTAPELTGETAGVVYTSTNPEVATVTPAGVVEILKAGTTTITASAEANDTHLAGSASYTLTVNKAARTLTFTESALEVTYGADVTEPTLNGVNDDETVVYTSSDETVVTVDASGAVTVIKAGQTTITATVAATETHETASAEYTLTVKKAARNLSFSPTSVIATLGKAFTSPVLSGVQDGETVVYSSSMTSVATIDNNGTVTLVDAGETTITATIAEDDKYLEGSAEYILTVKLPKLYVEDDSEYSQLYLYLYNSTGNNTWPGVQLSATEIINGVEYKVYTVPKDKVGKTYTYIFNNNKGSQVEEQKTITFDCDNYIWLTKKYTETIDEENTGKEDILTLYIQNNRGWDKLSYYLWNDKESNKTWPGISVDLSKKTKINNMDFYYVELKQHNWNNIIINHPDKDGWKTGDLTISDKNHDIFVSNADSGKILKKSDLNL